jgi:hypothetical protein
LARRPRRQVRNVAQLKFAAAEAERYRTRERSGSGAVQRAQGAEAARAQLQAQGARDEARKKTDVLKAQREQAEAGRDHFAQNLDRRHPADRLARPRLLAAPLSPRRRGHVDATGDVADDDGFARFQFENVDRIDPRVDATDDDRLHRGNNLQIGRKFVFGEILIALDQRLDEIHDRSAVVSAIDAASRPSFCETRARNIRPTIRTRARRRRPAETEPLADNGAFVASPDRQAPAPSSTSLVREA